MSQMRLNYIFDPLCGWCYACTPALTAVSATYSEMFEMLPCGLFSGHGARPLTSEWATYAWKNDQRIAEMTGQKFSDAYRTKVLLQPDGLFDSSFMNRALTETNSLEPTLQIPVLNALQAARYVDGLDTCDQAVVAQVTAAELAKAGHTIDAQELSHRLVEDGELRKQTSIRISSAQALLGRLELRSVPQLLLIEGDTAIPMDTSILYRSPNRLLQELEQISASPRM